MCNTNEPLYIVYRKRIVHSFGSKWNARRVTFSELPLIAQKALRDGEDVILTECPDGKDRRIVCINKRYYTRLV